MQRNELQELWVEELKDLYDAENRLVKALPKMAKASTSEELRSGFERHLEQTKKHVERLEEIFASLDEKPTGKKCAGMMGIIKEGQEIMAEEYDREALDAAIISAAQRVEHYEIPAYGTVRTWAELLGEKEASSLLQETLNEEKATDQKLNDLAQTINVEAMRVETSEEEPPRGRARGARA